MEPVRGEERRLREDGMETGSVNPEPGPVPSCELTSLQESNLVILRQHTEAWDVLCKLNHVLHGVSQSDGTVLPHLVHRLKASVRCRKDKCVQEEQLQKLDRSYMYLPSLKPTLLVT